MKSRKPFVEILSFLCILLLYQIPETSCASLRNYLLKSVSVIYNDSNTTTNLSDLIEFSPLNLSVELENITIMHQETEAETNPKIITVKLKTHFITQNPKSINDTVHVENGGTGSSTPNASESSLTDIEYVDPSDDLEFWSWKSNARTRKLNYFDENSNNTVNNDTEAEDSSKELILKSMETVYDSEDSEENKISEKIHRSKYATGRQFVFHPYLPYGKDTAPDEKLSFDDILPVKMVKFIKSMVEEAPWEQMFMKMVRMIVDQFVDKIIEKMFADKKHDDAFKKRSFDVLLKPTFVLPAFEKSVIRMKRSVATKISSNEEDDMFGFSPPHKKEQDTTVVGKKSASERKSWLDHFLDFAFPNSKSDMSDDDFDRLKKRDTTNTHFLKTLVNFFLSSFEKSSGFIADAKDVLRYKMLKEFLPYLYQKRYADNNFPVSSSNFVDAMKMSHRKLSDHPIKRNDITDNLSDPSPRRKRSTGDHSWKEEEDRLWQAHLRRHRPSNHRSHDECSLRNACNAGRLLSSFPSVQEITLQLRGSENEPHWDALIWGMKNKRCSRIFCKRQRSPKGSRLSWNSHGVRESRKDELITEIPDTEFEENNKLTA